MPVRSAFDIYSPDNRGSDTNKTKAIASGLVVEQ